MTPPSLQNEWRQLGVQQSRGWVHYAIHRPEPHIMLFRFPPSMPTTPASYSPHVLPVCGSATATWRMEPLGTMQWCRGVQEAKGLPAEGSSAAGESAGADSSPAEGSHGIGTRQPHSQPPCLARPWRIASTALRAPKTPTAEHAVRRDRSMNEFEPHGIQRRAIAACVFWGRL